MPEDLTAEVAGGRGWSEAGEGEGGGGFARTTFSDDGDGFSWLDGEGEVLDGDNAYQCEKCDKKITAVRRMCLKKLPNHLILVLKRFEFDYDTMQK